MQNAQINGTKNNLVDLPVSIRGSQNYGFNSIQSWSNKTSSSGSFSGGGCSGDDDDYNDKIFITLQPVQVEMIQDNYTTLQNTK